MAWRVHDSQRLVATQRNDVSILRHQVNGVNSTPALLGMLVLRCCWDAVGAMGCAHLKPCLDGKLLDLVAPGAIFVRLALTLCALCECCVRPAKANALRKLVV